MNDLPGAVVFIDDEIHDASSSAYLLLQEIVATGRPVTTDIGIPDAYIERFPHWKSLAFVIVDWDLTPGSMGLTGGDTLSGFKRKALYRFLADLMEQIYCPVFIVSGEDTVAIRVEISEDDRFITPNGDLDERIAIFSKDVVMDHLIDRLSNWVSASPALSALKAWEQQHDEAKNLLFAELTELEPDWPAHVWHAAELDEVDPAHELSSVISTNLLNRLNPVVFDVESISKVSSEPTGRSLRRVSRGRTSVPGARLSPRMVLPGDVFRFPRAEADVGADAEVDEVWINVSPACQTVGRASQSAGEPAVPEPVHLHLIQGFRQKWPANEGALKSMNSKDRYNSIIIHTLLDEHPYKFVFNQAKIVDWSAVSEFRVARLLPPFVTRLQQLHSAFMQSEGLPRVTMNLYA